MSLENTPPKFHLPKIQVLVWHSASREVVVKIAYNQGVVLVVLLIEVWGELMC